jgi:hypothetical protein
VGEIDFAFRYPKSTLKRSGGVKMSDDSEAKRFPVEAYADRSWGSRASTPELVHDADPAHTPGASVGGGAR